MNLFLKQSQKYFQIMFECLTIQWLAQQEGRDLTAWSWG